MNGRKISVNFVETEKMPDQIANYGHGVLFCHHDLGDIPIGLVDGYEWLKTDLDNVPIQILPLKAKLFENMPNEKAKNIVEETKLAIEYFFQHPRKQKDGKIMGGVYAWFNA